MDLAADGGMLNGIVICRRHHVPVLWALADAMADMDEEQEKQVTSMVQSMKGSGCLASGVDWGLPRFRNRAVPATKGQFEEEVVEQATVVEITDSEEEDDEVKLRVLLDKIKAKKGGKVGEAEAKKRKRELARNASNAAEEAMELLKGENEKIRKEAEEREKALREEASQKLREEAQRRVKVEQDLACLMKATAKSSGVALAGPKHPGSG